jgi:hypothetical protein
MHLTKVFAVFIIIVPDPIPLVVPVSIIFAFVATLPVRIVDVWRASTKSVFKAMDHAHP